MSTCVVKFDPRTIAAEVFYLEARQRAVLFSLLLSMWTHEGHIEDNDTFNSRRCGMRQSSYRRALDGLVASGTLQKEGGRLYPGARIQRGMRRVGITPEQRMAVLNSESTCAYCGSVAEPFEVDHIFPASRGGTNHRRNLTLACQPCNAAKRAALPSEWGAVDG